MQLMALAQVGKTDWAAVDAMTDAEVEAAALADPDCPPLRDDQTTHHMARAKRIRFNLRMSQQDFADRYHIPLSVLVAWERHEMLPDAVALALLEVIAADPVSVAQALARSAETAAAAAE